MATIVRCDSGPEQCRGEVNDYKISDGNGVVRAWLCSVHAQPLTQLIARARPVPGRRRRTREERILDALRKKLEDQDADRTPP
jgi:hypothetical protein